MTKHRHKENTGQIRRKKGDSKVHPSELSPISADPYTTEEAWLAMDLTQAVAIPESHLTTFEKIDLIRQGIPKKSLEYFKKKSGLDYDQLANLLSVARATLINKKVNEKFNQTLSERILRLADIYSQGYEVFGDLERFNTWTFRPNRALGGKAPYDLLDNDYGREEVSNLIGRIDTGIYS